MDCTCGFRLGTHAGEFASAESESGEDAHDKTWSLARAAATLVVASVLAAWMSEILVGAAEGAGKTLGMSSTFIGIVLLAIVGGRLRADRLSQWLDETRWT